MGNQQHQLASPPLRVALRSQRHFDAAPQHRSGSSGPQTRLKRDNGWRRTLVDTEAGARIWCGWGDLAHNTTKLSRLQAEAERQPAPPPGTAGQHSEMRAV